MNETWNAQACLEASAAAPHSFAGAHLILLFSLPFLLFISASFYLYKLSQTSTTKVSYPTKLSSTASATERTIYLDAAGAGVYEKAQIDAVFAALRGATFGNPHTKGPASEATKAIVERTRREVLAFFGVTQETHVVVFTAGATGGIKLVGENFKWTNSSTFYYQECAHTSVLGKRVMWWLWEGK